MNVHMGIDGFDRNKTSLTGAIFLSQSQNAAYRTPQCSQSLENNATESLSSHPSWPPPRGGMGRLFSLATLHIRIIVGSGISMDKWVHYLGQGPLYKWTEHSQNFIF